MHWTIQFLLPTGGVLVAGIGTADHETTDKEPKLQDTKGVNKVCTTLPQ
jgi:hypothetical protein